MALVELRNVSTIYHLGGGEIRALDCVSLTVAAVEFISIIGPSGRGKSILVHGLGCLDCHTSETILQLFHQPSREEHPIALLTHDPELAAATPRRIEIRDGKIARIVDATLAGIGGTPRSPAPIRD